MRAAGQPLNLQRGRSGDDEEAPQKIACDLKSGPLMCGANKDRDFPNTSTKLDHDARDANPSSVPELFVSSRLTNTTMWKEVLKQKGETIEEEPNGADHGEHTE